MTHRSVPSLLVLVALGLCACASGSRSRSLILSDESTATASGGSQSSAQQPRERSVAAERAASEESDAEPTRLRPDPEQVPAALRTIEAQIDRPSILLAEVIEIDVSRNYEWDVSLTGDDVKPQVVLPDGGTESVARGRPVAVFRNLELRGFERIVFRKSGFNVVPYLRITAKGRAVHASRLEGDVIEPLGRGELIRIDGSEVRYGGDAAAGAR